MNNTGRWLIGGSIVLILLIGIGMFSSKNVEPAEKMDLENEIFQPSTQKGENEQPMKKTYGSPPEMRINPLASYSAVLATDKGEIRVVLDASSAPKTVNNFVFLAKEGFYHDTVFHRIIKGFMIQGGDPLGNGTGGPGYRFDDEPFVGEYERGTIAMANAGPNTNGSQFFIMHADQALPKNYVIFGKIEASDSASFVVLDALANTQVKESLSGEMSSPVELVHLKRVDIIE